MICVYDPGMVLLLAVLPPISIDGRADPKFSKAKFNFLGSTKYIAFGYRII